MCKHLLTFFPSCSMALLAQSSECDSLLFFLVAEVQRGLASLDNAAERVKSAYADVDPDVADLLDKNKESVIDIQVFFDGTWQKRGFTSNYGVGVCIDIITGLVIDYVSLYCHTCVLKERQRVAN